MTPDLLGAAPSGATEAFAVGPTAFWLILGASIFLLALAFEQMYTFWRLVEHARDLGTETGKAIYRGDLAAARTVCERSRSPVADIFIAALNKASQPELLHRAAERERQRFGLWMKRRLWMIGTVGALAPFVGLFGTVLGIIRSFADIAASGAGGFSVVAQGVSQALQATAGGILVAVLAVLFYNYFQARGNRATVEVRLVVDEFLEQLQHDGRARRAEAAAAGVGSGSASDGGPAAAGA
ncbi:MAG: MotA/TolQ/ExbB proton channel family protein [Deltaproteobacteria bacterium]|nr:MotA/TolQ/ExbB proton channel family protein [Deltaproteobacteria bacterium]